MFRPFWFCSIHIANNFAYSIQKSVQIVIIYLIQKCLVHNL